MEYPSKKITFEETVRIVQHNELEKLKRSESHQRVYDEYVLQLKQKWKSVGTMHMYL